jgi:hypothetical protein
MSPDMVALLRSLCADTRFQSLRKALAEEKAAHALALAVETDMNSMMRAAGYVQCLHDLDRAISCVENMR